MNNKLCAVVVVLAILLAAMCITITIKGREIIIDQNRIIETMQTKMEKVERDNIGLAYANKYLKLLNNTLEDAWRDCRTRRHHK